MSSTQFRIVVEDVARAIALAVYVLDQAEHTAIGATLARAAADLRAA